MELPLIQEAPRSVELFAQAYVFVRTLRGHSNCSLPIEIFHAGDRELPREAKEALEALGGVRVRDAGASLAIVPGLGDTFEPICGVASVPLLKKLPSYAR